MNDKALKYLLLNIKAAAEAALALYEELDQAQADPEPVQADPAVCVHPEYLRVRTGTMGGSQWICSVCGHEEELMTDG